MAAFLPGDLVLADHGATDNLGEIPRSLSPQLPTVLRIFQEIPVTEMSSSLFSNSCIKTDRLCFFFFFGLECFLLWTESPALFLLWLTSLRDILTQQQTNSSVIKESKKIFKFLIWQNLQIIY